MSVLETTEYALPGIPEDGGLDICASRYRPLSIPPSRHRLSLLCAHGVSFHKESWVPTIEHLFDRQAQTQNNGFCIVEAWAIDAPNHGRAAALNDARLLHRPQGISAHEWARAVQVLLKSNLIQGTSIVAIGHSAGTCILYWSLSTVGYAIDNLPYSTMILVEPSMMSREVLARAMAEGWAWDDLISMAKLRKDVWLSRAAAREWMSTRLPWKLWTPRSIDLFVEHALRYLPTGKYPDIRKGVTLSCTRDQEAAGYIYHEDGIDSLDRLKVLCSNIPVHCIFGDRTDLVPEATKAAVIDPKQGRKMATISTVSGSGHLIVMEDPEGLARAIWDVLCHDYPLANQSRL